MSKENVELIRALLPAPDVDVATLFRDRSVLEATAEALASVVHPEVESVAPWQVGTSYSGVEGFRKLWLDWLEPWEAYYVRVDEVIDAGDRVVVLIRDRGRRHDTDAEVELVAASVWRISDGRIVRVEFYADRDEALRAAGLSE